jgi:hypothetical protein
MERTALFASYFAGRTIVSVSARPKAMGPDFSVYVLCVAVQHRLNEFLEN